MHPLPRSLSAALLAGALLVACDATTAPSAPTTGPSASSAAPSAPTTGLSASSPSAASTTESARPPGPGDPMPDPITHPCVVAEAQFAVALGRADASCQSNQDCDCYPGGIGMKSGCGGVTSRAAAKELHAIAARHRELGCQVTKQCAPWACAPRCENGKCVR